MISKEDLLSIGFLKRTHNKDLPEFIFVQRDGLFVPFRSERISELMGEEIWVQRSDIVKEEDGLFLWQDLVGFEMIDETGSIGRIAQVDESTINTLAILEDGRMIPLHEDFIVVIDPDAQEIHVRLPFAL